MAQGHFPAQEPVSSDCCRSRNPSQGLLRRKAVVHDCLLSEGISPAPSSVVGCANVVKPRALLNDRWMAIRIGECSFRVRVNRYELEVHKPPYETDKLLARVLEMPPTCMSCEEQDIARLRLAPHRIASEERKGRWMC